MYVSVCRLSVKRVCEKTAPVNELSKLFCIYIVYVSNIVMMNGLMVILYRAITELYFI